MTPRSLHAAKSADDMEVQTLRDAILAKLTYSLGADPKKVASADWYHATALAIRDRVTDIWRASSNETMRLRRKQIYYLSIEFLVGKFLFDMLTNLGLTDTARSALAGLGVELDDLEACEPDAGLGNGGLGRLAACYLDSMSALSLPAFGYGIRYAHGLFRQRIDDGQQQEFPDQWLAQGNPWEFPRNGISYPVRFGGSVEHSGGDQDTTSAVWHPGEKITAIAFDTPIAGWRGRHANTLRLWSARATEMPVSDMEAVRRAAEICDVLYPNDSSDAGKELRLRQEYFFTSASLQDLIARHLDQHETLDNLADHAAIQLNDTHPSIAVAELMRILVDERGFLWARAWEITRATLSYTNHTLMPEALESWPVSLLSRLLPRHLQIIYLINWLHLKSAGESGHSDAAFTARISLVHEDGERRIRMGHLAFLGSHCVNGVSALHTDLLGKTMFGDLAKVSNTRIVNKTNGITFRRWLFEANTGLTELLRKHLGERVMDDPVALERLAAKSTDSDFVKAYAEVRSRNKQTLAGILREKTGIAIDPAAMFDIHIKRIHEYKRQLLNVLEALALWQAIRANPQANWPKRVKIFAGKAAGSYDRAKLIIRLIHDMGGKINNDPVVGDKLKIVFVPNYSVSLAQRLVCAADLSEQISTAGMEASGTGNMKLALNGAITIGTLDGANVEIRDHVGADNVVIFGLTAQEVADRRTSHYRGGDAVSPELANVIDNLESGTISPDETQRYAAIVTSLLDFDPFMVAADFDSYWRAQRRVDALWEDPASWWRMSIENTARMGWFSSDRAIREYAEDIWKIPLAA